jgi:trk system potassium uptake protein TrkA
VEVVAIDRAASLVEAVRDEVTLAVRLDSTDEAALKAQGIGQVDAAIVGIGQDFEATVLTVAVLKSLNVPQIYARAENEIQGRILSRVGADDIVNPERESALRWAHRLTLPNLRQYVDLGEDHAIVYVTAPTTFQGKTLAELAMRARHGVNLVAIKREVTVQSDAEAEPTTKPVITVPQADTTILPDDVLILVGSNEALAQLPAD